jgi:hypothetical protein
MDCAGLAGTAVGVVWAMLREEARKKLALRIAARKLLRWVDMGSPVELCVEQEG